MKGRARADPREEQRGAGAGEQGEAERDHGEDVAGHAHRRPAGREAVEEPVGIAGAAQPEAERQHGVYERADAETYLQAGATGSLRKHRSEEGEHEDHGAWEEDALAGAAQMPASEC